MIPPRFTPANGASGSTSGSPDLGTTSAEGGVARPLPTAACFAACNRDQLVHAASCLDSKLV